MILNSSFGRMIFHITFYRNTISFSVNHNFISAYSTLSDTIGGHFWASKLLRTCRVIKVTIPSYICILSYIKIVYRPRNIPVQLKDGCRLLINIIVFIEHFNVEEILVHVLYNSWKTYTLLYRTSTVHPLCHDAAYDSCGALSRASHTYQHHLLNQPIERDIVYPVHPVTKKHGPLYPYRLK